MHKQKKNVQCLSKIPKTIYLSSFFLLLPFYPPPPPPPFFFQMKHRPTTNSCQALLSFTISCSSIHILRILFISSLIILSMCFFCAVGSSDRFSRFSHCVPIQYQNLFLAFRFTGMFFVSFISSALVTLSLQSFFNAQVPVNICF